MSIFLYIGHPRLQENVEKAGEGCQEVHMVLELDALAGKELLYIAREEPEPHLHALLIGIVFPVQGPLLASAIAGGVEVGCV